MQQGYRGFKVQFWDGLALDMPRFRAVREAVGPDFTLFQDAGGFYAWTEAQTVGYVLDELGYHWFEEPLPIARYSRSSDWPMRSGPRS